MFVKSSIVVAGFTAFSSAFVLPPPLSSEVSDDVITTLPFDVVTETDGKVVNLECFGCPVPIGNTQDGLAVMMTGIQSQLEIEFAINHLKSADVLTMNGIQLFPINPVLNAEPLKAAQIVTNPKIGADAPKDHFDVGLGYESRINLINTPNEKEVLALYNVRIQIIEVGGQFIDGLEAIEMKVIATPAGGLMIAEMIKSPTTNPALAPGAKCTTVLCKFKQVLTNKIGQMKPKKGGCGRGRGRKGVPAGLGSARKENRPHGKEEHHGHGAHHHRHHNRVHRFLRAIKSIALQVLIPVFVGIACGFAASMVGMIVGHAIVFVWRTFIRRGRKGTYTRVQQQDVKVGLLEEEALPAYQDEKVVVVDEKIVEL